MNTYVFFTRRIDNIDGARQYIYSKSQYLETKGWRVLVFSGLQRPIHIKGLEKYKKYIIPSLLYSPRGSRRQAKSIIAKIIEEIGDSRENQCIIESGYFPSSLWAELVASKLNCRHLVFLLQETHRYNNKMTDFLRFKYNRHELAGIVKDSICHILNDNTIEKREDSFIRAYANSIFDNCIDDYSELLNPSANYTLASIGRLIKPCVPAIIEGFCSYATLHPNMFFNVVMIGGSAYKGVKEAIQKKVGRYSNINLVLTGDIYPIPFGLIKKIDVFVSTAGSAVATYRACCPTIMVHPETGVPVGVIGLDFKTGEKTMYDSEKNLSIEGCIERAIADRNKIEYTSGLEENYKEEIFAEYDRQLSFVNGTNTNEYYDEKLLLNMRTPHLHYPFFHWVLEDILGAKGHQCVLALIGKDL